MTRKLLVAAGAAALIGAAVKADKKFAPGEILLLDSPHSRGVLPPSKVNFRGYWGKDEAVVVQDEWQTTVKRAWLSRITTGQRARRRATGQCFPFTNNMAKNSTNEEFFDKSKFRIVHGEVWAAPLGRYIVHGWVEKNGRAFDWQTREVKPQGFTIKQYYKSYKPRNMVDYTAEEVILNCLGARHEGPWEPHERRKGRGPRARRGRRTAKSYNRRVSKCISGKVQGEGWKQRRAVAACLNMDRAGRLREDGSYRPVDGK